MEKSYYLSRTFNEVIFKDRNKGYGAYELRVQYERNITIAAACGIILFASTILSPLIKEKYFPDRRTSQTSIKKEDRVIKIEQVIPIIEQPELVKQPAAKSETKIKTEVYAEPKVVPDNADVPEKKLANQENLKNAAFGKEKIEGNAQLAPDLEGIDGIDEGTGTKEEATPAIFNYAEEMPEFYGGEKAMLQYIGKKIKYPAMAQRENIQGLVVVTFVVAQNGDIKDAEVVKGLGYGMDEEAIRVVSSMPRWKPGKQNGKPVPVRYTLPIRFSMR